MAFDVCSHLRAKEEAMRSSRKALTGVAVLVAAATVAPGIVLGQSYVYPTRGQSPQQQQKDQGECHVWATQQSGVNPAAMAPPPTGPTGQVVGGAARGAAVGAVGGAIGGDAGKGAAIGAATGALVGGFRRVGQQQAAQQAQAQASASYSRANAACLEGRGYTVK
jgi:hypothetical protein